jgi:hypothetical protein
MSENVKCRRKACLSVFEALLRYVLLLAESRERRGQLRLLQLGRLEENHPGNGAFYGIQYSGVRTL